VTHFSTFLDQWLLQKNATLKGYINGTLATQPRTVAQSIDWDNVVNVKVAVRQNKNNLAR
jgi:hypothetical protein